MSFMLTPEQKKADIANRIRQARAEITPILAKYQVDIGAILQPTPHALIALPHWEDVRYAETRPQTSQQATPASTPEQGTSEAHDTDAPSTPSPAAGMGKVSPITRDDLNGGNGKKGKK